MPKAMGWVSEEIFQVGKGKLHRLGAKESTFGTLQSDSTESSIPLCQYLCHHSRSPVLRK